MRTRLAIAILLLSTARASAHRLDEYLQATLISIANDRLQVEMTLTPGVAVFPIVAADIDTDHDGVISETEQRAYAARVLRDLSLTIDGRPLTPRLLSLQFPTIGEMKEGLGGIRVEFQAGLPSGGRGRRFVLENRHQTRFGAYLVNCLVPRDAEIQILAQKRNDSQSHYELDYIQTSDRSASRLSAWWSDGRKWVGALALLLAGRFTVLWRRRSRAAEEVAVAPTRTAM
jgi:hypothetical protein